MLMGSALAFVQATRRRTHLFQARGLFDQNVSGAMTVEVAAPASSAIIHPVPTTRPEIGSIWRSTIMTHTAHTKKSLGCLPLLRAASLRVLGACAFRVQEMEPIRADVCLWAAVSGLSLGERTCKLRAASCIHPSS
jgi:hypothetical protein